MELNRLLLPPLTAPGEVVTFYSYKGGTGRTMALSNIAVLLARRQNASVPILMIDWDMEAPGLHHYFEQHEERPGVLEFFEACREKIAQFQAQPAPPKPLAPRSAGMRPGDGGHGGEAEPDDAPTQLALRVLASIDWEQYVVRVDQASPLYLMRAGRFDASYSDRLADMRWEQLFDACPALFRCFAASLARHFRYVLVDSRTGRTDSAGICTTLLPQKLVVVFTPNRQSVEGVHALVTRATDYRRSHEDEQRPLLVYPLPSRIEMDDGEQRAQWRRGDVHKGILGFQPMFERLLQQCYGLSQVKLDSYFDEVQLQQTKTFAYGEQLAVRIDQGGDRFSLTRTFEAFLDWMTGGYFPWQSAKEIHLLAAIEEARHTQSERGNRAGAMPLARDLKRLGELYRKEGRPIQALDCFQQSLTLRVGVLGDEHADTLKGKLHLASLLRQLNKLAEAQALEESVVEVRQRLLGPDHPDTLASLASLAATLAQRGDCHAALALQDRVADACQRVLGPEHLLTLTALASRASTLFALDQLDEARSVQESVAVVRERQLGAEHPDTLQSKKDLARTMLRQNELPGARRLWEGIITAHERRFGGDHPQTLAARESLADVLTQLGDLASLRLLHEGLVAARARSLGLDHPDTLISQRNLAAVLVQYGELDEARYMLEQVLTAHERVLGADHLDTLHSKSQLAGTLWRQGQQDAARVLEDAILVASAASEGGGADGARHLQAEILAARARARDVADPLTLPAMLASLQALIEAEEYLPACALANTVRALLLTPGVGSKLRKRGILLLKKLYRLQGDKDALVALQEDEVQALEGALSEARVQPLNHE